MIFSNNNNNLENEIDFKKAFFIFLKRKKIIAFISTLGFIFAGIGSLFLEKPWKGQVQIVLFSQERSNLLSKVGDPYFLNLKSEIEIFKSFPLIGDIFEYVKKEKIKNDKSFKDFQFRDWIQTLNFEYNEGNGLIDISYIDKDKTLIKKTLDKLSLKYINYFTSQRQKIINQKIESVEKNIKLYDQQNKEKRLQVLKIANDNNFLLIDIEEPREFKLTNQYNRFKIANEIKYLNEKIKNLQNIPNESLDLVTNQVSFDFDFRDISHQNLINEIKLLEEKISESSQLSDSQEKSFRILRKKKEDLLLKLRSQLLDFYKTKLIDKKDKLNASEQSLDILLEYSILKSNLIQDLKFINELKKQYKFLLIEKDIKNRPGFITKKPYLLGSPIGPSRSSIALIGLFGGILLGSIISLLLELKSGKVMLTDEVETSFEFTVLESLSINKINNWDLKLRIFYESFLKSLKGSLAIYFVEESIPLVQEKLDNYAKKNFGDRKILITTNFESVLEFDNLILVVTLDKSKINELNEIKRKLTILNKNVYGVIIIRN